MKISLSPTHPTPEIRKARLRNNPETGGGKAGPIKKKKMPDPDWNRLVPLGNGKMVQARWFVNPSITK